MCAGCMCVYVYTHTCTKIWKQSCKKKNALDGIKLVKLGAGNWDGGVQEGNE